MVVVVAASPFLLSVVLDVDELHLPTDQVEAGVHSLSLFSIPAVAVVGVLEVSHRLALALGAALRLCGFLTLAQIVEWLQGTHVIARGATVHFFLQYCLRVTDRTAAVALTTGATALLLAAGAEALHATTAGATAAGGKRAVQARAWAPRGRRCVRLAWYVRPSRAGAGRSLRACAC